MARLLLCVRSRSFDATRTQYIYLKLLSKARQFVMRDAKQATELI